MRMGIRRSDEFQKIEMKDSIRRSKLFLEDKKFFIRRSKLFLEDKKFFIRRSKRPLEPGRRELEVR
jgi:hypothetical protein